MLLELAQAISFFISLVSLYPVLYSAFFIIGASWEERLLLSLNRLALSGCISFASGLLFLCPKPRRSKPRYSKQDRSLFSTLPVQLFLCAAGVIALLSLAAWYLDTNCVPRMCRNAV